MKMTHKYLVAALLLCALRQHAQNEGESFSLQQAIDYALKNSPSMLNAKLDVESADYRRKEVTGMGLPQVTGSIDLKGYLALPTSLLPAIIFNPKAGPTDYLPVKFGTKYNATAGISARQ